jgi:hypothetical protein
MTGLVCGAVVSCTKVGIIMESNPKSDSDATVDLIADCWGRSSADWRIPSLGDSVHAVGSS